MRKPLTSILSSLPERFHQERAELLDLLLLNGILHRSPTQPILSRDGTSARWMLNSLAVTLGSPGAELAGRCILELLKHFDGRQIATYGLTGVPILQSCIIQSNGRYRGLLVRKERKKHGSLKLIEGIIDPDEPTILIDDSISSGTSMVEGCEKLEEAGLRVEGGVALVRFGWYGGYALMQERGYHVEALYDIYDDFMSRMEDEHVPPANPLKYFPDFEWSSAQAPEGLHPAKLARLVLEEMFRSALLLRPPRNLDNSYDASGGAWVSVRSRENVWDRHARDGFWHFPGEKTWDAPEAIIRAALRTSLHLPDGEEGKRLLDESSIAVTFFSPLEKCTVGQLDNDRYGIVVCSAERTSRMGGALPRMPGIGGDWRQFQHARVNNADLISFEPFTIHRHDVLKIVEPGAVWQPSGVPMEAETPWFNNRQICGRIAARARDILNAKIFGTTERAIRLPNGLLPEAVDSLFVSVYLRGVLRGCMGSSISNLESDLRNLAHLALEDSRFTESPSAQEPDEVAVTVSFLFNALDLGSYSPEEVEIRIRHGQQALMVSQGNRSGLLLPFVAVMNNLGPSEYVAEVIDKAGVTRPPYNWRRFDCATWLADEEGESILDGAFPVSEAPKSLEELTRKLSGLHVAYLLAHLDPEGLLFMRYYPVQNKVYRATGGAALPRIAHASWLLSRTSRLVGGEAVKNAADKFIDYYLSHVRDGSEGAWVELDESPTVAEASFLLLALCELPADDVRRQRGGMIAKTLWSSIDRHGRISTHKDSEASADTFQDYFPGQVLLALAAAAANKISDVDKDKLERAFKYYRHRFRYKRDFGQVSWLMQAFGMWWRIVRDDRFADFVFEICDWILEYQQEKTGAFINDHQFDSPGYTTALYLEGVGAAVRIAALKGDEKLHQKYLDSFTRGLQFLDRLVIQPRDSYVLPNPSYAIGGLRQSIYRSEIRIDFVQHSLSAILELYEK